MTGWRRLTGKIIVPVAVLCLAALAAFHPEGQWRVRLVSLKLAHKLPQAAWADLAIGSVPGSSRLNKVREMVTPIWPCWIEKLDLSLEESNEQDLRAYSVFNRPTAITKNLETHVSFLSAGHTPHPPHQHPEEELILVLSGEHCCPVKSRIESIGWGHRGIRFGSRMAGVPVKRAFFRIA